MECALQTTAVYETYWRFAAERQAMYLRRLSGGAGPWTCDPILRAYRFTNAYRAADRVSQYLIGEVQYGAGRAQAPNELFFRTLLFKLFNKIETWERIEGALGSLSWQSADFEAIEAVLDRAFQAHQRLYSAAYIMPSPALGGTRKYANHLALLKLMMEDGLPGKVQRAGSLQAVYALLKTYPGLGPFLAFQFTIDLNYSNMLDLDEGDFVVAGPGALDGIAKCFSDTGGRSPEQVIHLIAERQDDEFARRGLQFDGLFGRRLQPIDCQNLFCEISKYARAAHPEVVGVSGRTRIKQSYRSIAKPLQQPTFPPRWGLKTPHIRQPAPKPERQLALL